MASEPLRDPIQDPLLTPKNCAFIVIDYQPVQVNSSTPGKTSSSARRWTRRGGRSSS